MRTKNKARVAPQREGCAECWRGKIDCTSCDGTTCACPEEKECIGGCGTCPECDGSGELNCEVCDGTGFPMEDA